MTKEQLLALGLSEEQVTNILKIHKESIDGNFIAKHRFDEVNGELKNVKEQVSERDKQIAELKKFEGDAKELKEKITSLETENAAKDKEYQATLSLERKKAAVKLALLEDSKGKPHDADMVMGLFNLEQIIIDEATGKITGGFTEQGENLRKEKPFLFSAEENEKPSGWKPAGNPPPEGDKGKDDNSSNYGKSLAQIKLEMMGVKPAGDGTTN